MLGPLYQVPEATWRTCARI